MDVIKCGIKNNNMQKHEKILSVFKEPKCGDKVIYEYEKEQIKCEITKIWNKIAIELTISNPRVSEQIYVKIFNRQFSPGCPFRINWNNTITLICGLEQLKYEE